MKTKLRKILVFILMIFFISENCSFFGLPFFQIKKVQAALLITDFAFKKDITFNTTAQGANVSTAQANFPVAVHINSSSWSSATERGHFFGDYNNVSGHEGKRIQFFDSDGTTNLSYEVEYYSNAGQEAIYWVRVPSVAGNSSTDKITLAYGNDPNGADQDNKTDVWSSYSSAWHFPDGSSLGANDSATLADNGSISGSVATGGIVDGGANFDGNDSIAYSTTKNNVTTESFTISAVIKRGTASAGYYSIMVKRENTGYTGFIFGLGNDHKINAYLRNSVGASVSATSASTITDTTTFHHVAASFDRSGNVTIYIDGVTNGTPVACSAGTATNNVPLMIGYRATGTTAWTYFNGVIDESRKSNSVLTTNWIKLEYYSMKKTNYNGDNGAGTSKFITFGSEQSSGSLSIDIVDGSGNSVASPSVSFASKTFSFANQTATGTFGTASQKIRVSNVTGTQTWTANLAGSATTTTWTSGANHYDFNDSSGSGYTDGADADSYGGQLTVDPSGGTITGVSGCSTDNVSKGASDSFVEGSNNSIDLFSASTGASAPCKWDLTGVSLTQKIPASQPAGSYSINLVLTVS